jgi:hypothetical protein
MGDGPARDDPHVPPSKLDFKFGVKPQNSSNNHESPSQNQNDGQNILPVAPLRQSNSSSFSSNQD